MAKFMDITHSALSIMLVLVVLIHELVDGRTIQKASNNAIIKTIKGDNGEIFDCYDVYKQPILNNPLFHNHKIQYAMVTLQGEFRGAQAKINIWKPETEPGEYSAASISVIADDGAEAISAGWRADHFQKTGCDDIKCPDFVLISSTVDIGSIFDPTSVLMGSQYDVTFAIFQLLSVKENRLDFGGQIANTKKQGHHSSTDMGSDHLPSEGNFGVSSYFQQVKTIDLNHIARAPGRTSQTKTVMSYECL
ncbi:uncharacterized protein LOC113296596 [Papaver somniferum]|uniref:uncharacterized protein LOC113296596 n=1 Tax=Papaver somniferum TaxID=3469 RepID=UPI000E6F5D0C|nr:uncharacterized protein LOC113296596 [Papaver somniferum]